MVECGSVDGEWFELVGGVRCSVGQWGEGMSGRSGWSGWSVGRWGRVWVELEGESVGRVWVGGRV